MQDTLEDLLSPPEHEINAAKFIAAVILYLEADGGGRIDFDERDIMNLTVYDLKMGPGTVADLLAEGQIEEARRHQEATDALDAESADKTRVQVVFWGNKPDVMQAAKVEVDRLAKEFQGGLDPALAYQLQDTQNEPLKGYRDWCYVLEYVFSS